MTTVIICATQRSGSTMVLEDMRNTGVMGLPEEWFLTWERLTDEANFKQELEGIKRRASTPNGVMSVKVMANQLIDIENGLKTFFRPQPGPTFFRFHKYFSDASWVRIIRKNVVEQAISRVMAQQTGVNHATRTSEDDHFAGNLLKGYSENYNEKAKFNYDAILLEATSITLENIAWDKFFAAHGIEPLTLVYEDYSKDDKMGHLDRIADSIGLSELPERKPRKMVKVGNQLNKEFEKKFFKEAADNKFRTKPPL